MEKGEDFPILNSSETNVCDNGSNTEIENMKIERKAGNNIHKHSSGAAVTIIQDEGS